MKKISQHSRRLQAANGPLDRSTGTRGQSKSPLSGYRLFVCLLPMRSLFSSMAVLYYFNRPIQHSPLSFLRKDERTERNVWKFERRKGDCITQSTSSLKRFGLRNVTVLLQFRDSKDVHHKSELAGQTSIAVKRIPLSIKTFTPDPALLYNNTHDSLKRKTLF